MGCDIHTYVEVRRDGAWHYVEQPEPDIPGPEGDGVLGWRSYGMFGFLADVRNYSRSPVIAQPRGLPDDMSAAVREEYGEGYNAHSTSWLTLAELRDYDYDQVFWDRRVTKGSDGAALAEEGEGRHLPLREFLGSTFFRQLDTLAGLGEPEDVRIVFWFSS